MKKLAVALLRASERFYLRSHGWDHLGNDEWHPPQDYPFKVKYVSYQRRHAVNAQHQVNAKPAAVTPIVVQVPTESLETLLRRTVDSGKPSSN